MSLFNETKCLFYTNENNLNIKTNEYECTIVCQSGSVSFIIYEVGNVGLQFLLNEENLKSLLTSYKTIEDDGIYINFKEKNILPEKCKIKIYATTSRITLHILNINAFLEIETENFKNILGIKQWELT